MPEISNSADEPAASQQLNLQDALELALKLHQANEFEAAESIYRQLLELEPENADLLHFFGLLRHQRGYREEGAAWINKALELAPDYLDAHNNLGNIFLQTGHPDLAEPCFRRVLELNPDFVTVYGNLGIALRQLDRYDEAIDYFLQAIALEPREAHHYQNIGNAYRSLKQFRQAVGSYRKSLELQPLNPEAYKRLVMTFFIMGEIESCVEVLNQWLELEPENPTALHLHAAYTGGTAPARASDDYVRQTFDGFAASFDGVLKRLDYRAPFLVQAALQRLNPDPSIWRLLDAGCGTGLCGALVRPLVKHLAGVDLSPKMLEHAQVRGVYDVLFEAELTRFFAQAEAAYEAISCVDTFCYFGDLSAAVAAAVKALQPGGWFVFTLEELTGEAEAGFHLEKHGRYSHTEAYIRKILADAGFRIIALDKDVLRKEGLAQVRGLVVTAQLA